MPRKEVCDCPEQCPAWMTTFSDLMSLLLCFFVLIVSMSKIRENDYYLAAGSLRGAFGVMTQDPAMVKLPYVSIPTLKNIQRAVVSEAVSNLQDFIKAQKQGVALSLASPLLFDSGSAELKPEAFPLLQKVFAICQGWPNIIRVQGYTDNTPVAAQNTTYKSNWDLAFERALGVVNFAVQFSKIHPSRLVPVSFGEYRPVADNATAEGRAKNRRIEIMMEYKKDEPDPFK